MQVNLVGPFRLAQPLASPMRDRGSGHVVTIGSISDRTAFPSCHRATPTPASGTPIDPDHRPGFTPRAKMLHPEAVADAVLYVLTRDPESNIDELRLSRS